jgi:sugar lactone lactonase YvrE
MNSMKTSTLLAHRDQVCALASLAIDSFASDTAATRQQPPFSRTNESRAPRHPITRHAPTFIGAAAAFLATAVLSAPAFAQTARFTLAESTIRTGLAIPYSIAVDQGSNIFDPGGKIYIADAGNNQVLMETPSPNGYSETTIGGGLSQPYGVAVDTYGSVYIADTLNHRVLKETLESGTYVQSTVASGLGAPTGVAVDASGNVYIADSQADKVFKETLDGVTFTQSTVRSGLLGPQTLAVDTAGNVYITLDLESYVLKEKPSGAGYVETKLGSGLKAPYGITIDRGGNVFIADTGNNRILKETPSGSTYTQSTVQTVSALDEDLSVAVDESGNLYLSYVPTETVGQGKVLEESAFGGNFQSVNVGTKSPAISFLFTIETAGKLGHLEAPAEGQNDLDFEVSGGSCKPGTEYTAGETCTVDVTFKPLYTGMRYGAAVLTNSAGTPIAAGYAQGSGSGPQINFMAYFQAGIQSKVPYSTSGESAPFGIAVDEGGNFYIADSNNNRVLKESRFLDTYLESTIGTGLDSPTGVAVDGAGNVYIADTQNSRVLKEFWTGSGYIQSTIGSGLDNPYGVAVDGLGNVYISDTLHKRVLKETWTGSSYVQITVPTSGVSLLFGIAVDGAGDVIVADTQNKRVLKETLTNGSYTQSVVQDGFKEPFGVAVDGNGNVFVADFEYQYIDKGLYTGPGGYSGETVPGFGLIAPYAVAVDGAGNLYVADVGNNAVFREDYADPPALTFDSTDIGQTSADSPEYIMIENLGNAPLTLPVPATGSNPSVAAAFIYDSSQPSSCPDVASGSATPGSIEAGWWCYIYASFAPQAAGTMNGSLVLTDNSLNAASATQTIALSGVGVLDPQTIDFATIATQIAATKVALSATATSGLPVVFTSQSPSVCTISGTTASLISYGFCDIKASQAGNSTYAATSTSQTFGVSHASQTINFPAIATQTKGANLTLVAAATSALPVSFTSLTPSVCTVSGTTASLIATGTCRIQANQAGNNEYLGAPPVTQSFTVAP